MSAFVVKAICRRIQARYGSNQAAAMAAGVTPGVWSTYCSDDHPDTTIPFHRLLVVANAQEKAAFIALLRGDDEPTPANALNEACETSEASGDLLKEVREAEADGVVTPLEKRRIRDKALLVQAQAGDVIQAVSAA